MKGLDFSTNYLEKEQKDEQEYPVRLDRDMHKPRPKKLVFISLVCFCFLLALLVGYLQLWNVPSKPAVMIKPSTAAPTIKSSMPSSGIKPTATKQPSQNWQLVFNDEFDEASLDPQKWNIEDPSGGYQNCCLNYGEQLYTPQAISFSQGSLRIETQRQDINGYSYTSGAITTENNFSFKYGRVDIRAKLPTTQGYWPAFWLLPDNSVGIAPFEIDIMELLGKDPTTMYMVNHWGSKKSSTAFTGPDFSQDYHVFSIVWTSQSISWYVDGVQRFQATEGISNQNMYLIINSTLGGKWGGNADQSTVLPQDMDIDYVRIYQPVSGGSN